MRGSRVLTADHRAVLAVDEGLRYGPLKAGYHGGASAAEVVVPVAVLVPGENRNPLGLPLLPPQMPTWWLTRDASEGTSEPELAQRSTLPRTPVSPTGPTLFGLEELETSSRPESAAPLGRSVVQSAVYRSQRKVTGRLIVTDDQVAALITAVAAARDHRLPMALAARGLGVSEVRLRGALAQVQQLLNVEGYGVLQTDPRTRTVILDEGLLREQFRVS